MQLVIAEKPSVGMALANHDKDDFAYKKAVDVLVQYGLHDKNAELSAEMYDTDNPDVFKIREGAYLVNVEVTSTIEMWERFKTCSIEPKTEAENRIMFETDGDNWLRYYIPDRFGNKTNSIDARDICTPPRRNGGAETGYRRDCPVSRGGKGCCR